MEPSAKLRDSMRQEQLRSDEQEEEKRHEEALKPKRALIGLAQDMAKTYATIHNSNGSQLHDYYSKWACYRQEIDDMPGVQMEARLHRVHTNEVKSGFNLLRSVTIDFRLFDTDRQIPSGDVDEGVITFTDDEIVVRTDEGIINVEPDTSVLQDIYSSLEVIDRALGGHFTIARQRVL